ncbi:MAG TPA: ornithine carbamoyltransferase, partial [Opitutaceae bacterium]
FALAQRWAAGGDLTKALQGRKIAFLGDTACNVANSWILGANLFGMKIALAGPPAFAPTAALDARLKQSGFARGYQFTADPFEAVKDADVVYTDVWVSMGKEQEGAVRLKQMAPYAVTTRLFAAAKPDAYFMHCLPAHPGEEVAPEVLASPRSIIFDQAEDRLHMQKAILSLLSRP